VQTSCYKLILWDWVRHKLHFIIWYQKKNIYHNKISCSIQYHTVNEPSISKLKLHLVTNSEIKTYKVGLKYRHSKSRREKKSV